jgi:hypothetical protein
VKSLKNKIIVALSIIIAILTYITFDRDDIIKSVTRTKIEFIPEVSRIVEAKPISVVFKKIKVPIIRDSISKDTVWMEKNVKKYSYIDSLKNGIIKSDIIADHIYSRNVELKTFQKKITKETTNTIVKSMLFLDVGVNKYTDKTFRDVNIGVNYTRKDKWRVGVTAGYDFTIADAFIGIKIGIPLN